LQQIISESTKIKKYSFKEVKIKPWITSGIIRSIRVRDGMSRRLRTQPFNVAMRSRFKKYRNTLSKIITKAKEFYYRSKITESRTNSRRLWKNITEIIGTKKLKDEFPVKAFLDNKDNIGDNDIIYAADKLNEYYVGVGANLASAIPPVPDPVVRDEDFWADSTF
jgi:hypothetical protein